jgi:hypothetical protein
MRRMALWTLVSAVGASAWTVTRPADVAHAAGQSGPSPQAEEHIKQLVVMLKGSLGEQLFNGAGIIVGRTSDRLYIVTAHHVVRQATQQAEQVEAQFRWLPGEWKKARVLEHGDVDLDLAMLAVDASEVPNADLEWAVLADEKALVPGARVFPIGFPNGMPWFRPQLALIINNFTVQRIHTEGQVFPGNSGGALVTDDGRLIGLVSNVSALLAASIRMERIMEKLKDWRYPVSLTSATSLPPTRDSTPPPTGPDSTPKPRPPDSVRPTRPEAEPAPSRSAAGTCWASGTVVDGEGRPLSGVHIGIAARVPGTEQYNSLTRTAVITSEGGTFRLVCPTGLAREQFPLRLIVWHPDLRMKSPDIEMMPSDQAPNLLITVSLSTTRESESTDDCVAIRPGALRVDHDQGRGGWHVVATDAAGVGNVLLPDFETNEDGARAVALVLQKYNVTQYCQIGRPPAVFYFLSRGAPVLLTSRARGGPGAVDVVERCRPFNGASLVVAAPDTMNRSNWSIREGGQILFLVTDEALGRRALSTIRRHGFTSICYPGRPMSYLR